MVEHDLAKVDTRVRFPSLAPEGKIPGSGRVFLYLSSANGDNGPMIELHCHLDGSLSKEDVVYLCRLNHKEVDIDKVKLSADKSVRDLTDYIACFEFPISLLQTYESIVYATYSLYKRLSKQGILYAEVRFAPQQSLRQGLSQEQVVQASIKGLEMAKQETGIAGQLILCLMRGVNTHEANFETVDVAEKYLGMGVCALDLAGAEIPFPTSDYAKEFSLARNKGIPFTIHAGEAVGPQSVWEAVRFGAVRIGHGIHAMEDPQLMAFIQSARIGLEVCPTSEVDTHCIPSYEACPIPEFFQRDLLFCLGADDMTISSITLPEEFKKASKAFGIDADKKKKLLLNAVEMAFLDGERKDFLREKVLKKFQDPDDEF